MVDKIYIGNFPNGLVLNPLPFNIDNNAFPFLYNFYVWRGRAKKKRGTTFLGRLRVFFSNTSAGNANLTVSPQTYSLFSNITAYSTTSGPVTIATAQQGANIVPGTVAKPLVITVGAQTLTDTTGSGTFVVTGVGIVTAASINYATGVLTLTFSAPGVVAVVIVSGSYYPGLPVMGLRSFVPSVNPSQENFSFTYPQLLAFDTQYSYQNLVVTNLGSTTFFNTNYYKNPNPAPAGYTSYTPKTTQTSFVWTGQNYQQFWTTNFEQALWATNGTPGMQIQSIKKITWSDSKTLVINTTDASPAIKGDFVFVNEITGTNNNTINGQTGYVTDVSGADITIKFPSANISHQAYSNGIVQYLTNSVPTASSPSMGDGIKWYDGDPTGGTGLPSSSSAGWVNFAPPLSATEVTIDNFSSSNGKPFYLVGAKIIFPYKDRVLFFGVYITTSANAIAGNAPIYLQDTVIWSWNGSPYYTASFDATVTPIVYQPILTPGTGLAGLTAEGAAVTAYYVDQTGLGGYLTAGLQQAIVSVGLNEDVLMVAFTNKQTRLAYTSNDISPFLFFSINSELGASATFSSITLDRGVITFGTYGFALTTQESSQRIDLQIPDESFQIRSTNFGTQRISSVRDFYKEWLYFSYCTNDQPTTSSFPTQTFFYNYRDDTWAIFYENFTAHGSFWRYSDTTWEMLTDITWEQYTDPWNSGQSQALFPTVVAGTPQGFIVVKGQNTGEAPTGYISAAIAYTVSTPYQTQITSYNHCVTNENPVLETGDYLYITNCLGPVNLNGHTCQVTKVIDANNFLVDIPFAWLIVGISKAASAVVNLIINPYATHNFIVGQSITITGVVGMVEVNNNTYTITAVSATTITLNVDSTGFTTYVSGGVASPQPYQGLGLFTRLVQPFMQSKQFPPAWGEGRQVRFGTQQYLMDATANGQVTLNLYLSMDPDNAWNNSTIDTDPNDPSEAIIYSKILYTCPESTNLGLTPANINLQMPTAATQRQIWHRMNTSLIGDTVQFGITLSDLQMRDVNLATSEITLHAAVMDIYPGPYLS